LRRLREASDRTIRVALAVLTLAVRVPLFLRADLVSYDGTYYINQAKALLHGSLGGGAFPIGYPLLIAPLLAVLRDGVLAGTLVSLVASIGSVVVFDSLCRRHLQRPLALFAAMLFALTPLFMRASVLTVSESAYTFWVLLSLLCFDARAWASGLAIGMAAATRPEAVAVAGALGIVAAYRLLRRRASARSLAAFALGFVVVYGAGVAAMSVSQGRLTLLSRAQAFESVTMPWQLREKSVDYAGKERFEAELEQSRPGFDRRASYGEVMREEVGGLARHLMVVVPALALVGVVVRRGFVAVALIPLLFIPLFTEARGQVRWLVPYLAPLLFYASLVLEKMRSRWRPWATALVATLAAASLYVNRSVYHTGVESEYASTRDVARRFAARIQPGDAVAGRKPYFAFYAGARYVEIPAAPYDETVDHVTRDARYLALEEKTVDRLRPILRPLIFDAAAVRGELRLRQIEVEPTGEFVYERTGAVDSLSMRRLTTPDIGDLTPSWSPDGKRIAFRRFLADGAAAVFVIDRDGANLRELARTSRERDPIAWSPDGTRVVYTALVDGNFELMSLDVNSRRTTRMASSPSHEWSPSFARDTGAFIFCSDRDGTPASWMLARGAHEPVRVSLSKSVADLASLSPSGDRAAWVDLDGRLIFWNLAAREGTGVFEPRGVISPASWSPDASTVVVEAFDWSSARLYLVDAKNGHALMLTHSRTGDGMPSWSPDGKEIVAVTARNGAPSVWVYGNLAPYLNRLRAKDDVRVMRRPDLLRTPPPAGLRRVLPERAK
jgi:PAS domain-containing protein